MRIRQPICLPTCIYNTGTYERWYTFITPHLVRRRHWTTICHPNAKILKITSKYIPAFSYNISFAKDYRSRIDFYKYNKKKPTENEGLSNANKDYKPFENIEEDIAFFEQRRLNQYRLLLLHFLHDKLVYHTQSFQKIGEMYKKVRDQLIIEYPQNEINNEENEE